MNKNLPFVHFFYSLFCLDLNHLIICSHCKLVSSSKQYKQEHIYGLARINRTVIAGRSLQYFSGKDVWKVTKAVSWERRELRGEKQYQCKTTFYLFWAFFTICFAKLSVKIATTIVCFKDSSSIVRLYRSYWRPPLYWPHCKLSGWPYMPSAYWPVSTE